MSSEEKNSSKKGDEVKNKAIFLETCKVSVQVQTIVEMLYQLIGCDEAYISNVYFNFRMNERFETARAVVELYVALVHEASLQTAIEDARSSIVFYNDCMYMSYHLLTLAFHHRLTLKDNDTFIDLVPILRSMASTALENELVPFNSNGLNVGKAIGLYSKGV